VRAAITCMLDKEGEGGARHIDELPDHLSEVSSRRRFAACNGIVNLLQHVLASRRRCVVALLVQAIIVGKEDPGQAIAGLGFVRIES